MTRIIGLVTRPILIGTFLFAAAGLRLPAALAQCAVDDQVRLVPDGIESGDFFGSALSVSDTTAVIGAYGDEGAGRLSGAAYVFQRVGNEWAQTFKLRPADGGPLDQFGSAVAALEKTALIGAYYDGDHGVQSGSAYIFQRTDNGWEQAAKLRPIDASSYDHFGYAVSLGGDLALIGAPQGPIRGTAYVFQGEGSAWGQSAKLIAPDAAPGSRFGHAVALYRSSAIVGAPGDAAHGPSSGSAFVFQNSDDSWVRTARLTASDGGPNDRFGVSVAIFDDLAIVGAEQHIDRGIRTGAAYVFQREANYWRQVAKLTPADPVIDARFGAAVALRGGTAVVAAPHDDNGGFRTGSAYLFHGVDGQWRQVIKLQGPGATADTQFGVTAALSGQAMLIGSMRRLEGDRYTGLVFTTELGGCCVPIAGTVCGASPRACVEATESCCQSLGGEFVGVGISCEHQVREVNHEGPPGGWSHKIVTVSDCASGRRGRAPCTDTEGPLKIDPWVSARGATTNCEDFGGPTGCPIPAEFFGPGSDVFHDRVCLRGEPLRQVTLPEFGATLDFEEADTLVLREADPFSACGIEATGLRQLEVAVERLKMKSCEPVIVTYNGGLNAEPWDVQAEVETSEGQPRGMMTVRLEHCNGGTFDSELRVCPRFIFRKISDPSVVREIDYCSACNAQGIRITSTKVPWVITARRNVEVISPVCSAFHPGVKEIEPRTHCDCNQNGQRDECDVLYGQSADCNNNGRPDECDPESRDMALFVRFIMRGTDNPMVMCFYDANRDGQLDSRDIPGFVGRLLRR